MMKNKNLLLGVLLAVLVLLIVLPKMMPETKGYPERFAELDTSRVTALDISKGEDRVRIDKQNGQWWLTEPVNWKADARALDRLLAELPELGARALINKNTGGEADDRYELGADQATILRVYEGAEERLALRIGKASQDFSSGFVRYDDSEPIYRSNRNLSSRVPSDPARWLDKLIYKEEQDNLATVQLHRGDGTLSFSNADTAWSAEWSPKRGRGWFEAAVDEAAFSTLRNGVLTLRMSELATAEQAARLAEADIVLSHELGTKDGRSRKVDWARLEDEESKVFCRVDGQDQWLSLYKSSLERLEKEPGEFRSN